MAAEKVNWKVLIGCLVVVYAVAFLGSIFTPGNTDSDWYDAIQPEVTPANWVFPVVWNVLFFLIAMSLYFCWNNSRKKGKIMWVFGINFVLNVFWSFTFFGEQNVSGAFVVLIALWLSIISMIYVAGKVDKKAGWLLVPYLAWVTFAGYLNYLIVFG